MSKPNTATSRTFTAADIGALTDAAARAVAFADFVLDRFEAYVLTHDVPDTREDGRPDGLLTEETANRSQSDGSGHGRWKLSPSWSQRYAESGVIPVQWYFHSFYGSDEESDPVDMPAAWVFDGTP